MQRSKNLLWLVAIAAFAEVSHAQVLWLNPSGGAFQTTTNWSSGVVPGPTDAIRFNLNSTYPLTYVSSANVNQQFVDLGNLSVNLGGFSQSTAGGLFVGRFSGDNPAVTFTNGTFSAGTTVHVGDASGGTGRLTLQGPFNLAAPELVVAQQGSGTMSVVSGATATINGSAVVGTSSASLLGTGYAAVDGGTLRITDLLELGAGGANGTLAMSAGQTWVDRARVGARGGAGTMLLNGGILRVDGDTFVGFGGTARGFVQLSGATTSADFNFLRMAGHDVTPGPATAQVQVIGGARAITTSIEVGNGVGDAGTLLVAGANSVVDSFSGTVVVGFAGNGVARVEDGGRINCQSLIVANSSSSASRLVVSGTGSQVNEGNSTRIGLFGNGSMSVLSGGVVNSRNAVVGAAFGGRGSAFVSGAGSRWNVNDGFFVAGESTIGSVEISNAGLLVTKDFTVGNFSGGAGTLSLDGPATAWISNPNGDNAIGRNSGSGTLLVRNGASATIAGQTFLGRSTGSSGFVLVDGADSQFEVSANLGLGFRELPSGTCNGTLIVSGGGLVRANSLFVGYDGGEGAVTVTGNGSRLDVTLSAIRLGNTQSASGRLAVTAGGVVTCQGSLQVGHSMSSLTAFDLLVRDPGSLVRAQDAIFLGQSPGASRPRVQVSNAAILESRSQVVVDNGLSDDPTLIEISEAGKLRINADSTVSASNGILFIGSGSASVARVSATDAGSEIEASAAIVVGRQGRGELVIANGATATSSTNTATGAFDPTLSGVVGRNATGIGTATITGTGSRWNQTATMVVGYSGTGTLKVLNGGQLNSTDGVIARDPASAGSVTLGGNDAAWRVAQNLSIGGIATFTGGTGYLSLQAGGKAVVGDLARVFPTGSVEFGGGQLDLTDGMAVFDYSGPSPLSMLTGKVTTGYANGSWTGPGISSSVAAVTMARALGIVEATDLFSSFPATFRGQSVDSSSVLIAHTLTGDGNLNGLVEIGDFALLAASFNSPGRWYTGDFNFDGTINISDFALLAANFGFALPSTAPRNATVPEPANQLAIGCLLATPLAARRERSSRHTRISSSRRCSR